MTLPNSSPARFRWLATAATVALFIPAGAWAEDAADQRDETITEAEAGRTAAPTRPARSDIVVTGRSLGSDQATQPLPVQVLSGDELAHRRRGTLGETLDGLPGVHMDNFGAGASRPGIRGQTMPRIEILTDGANLFDVASVSPDHAIVTDPLLLDAIEIQRGPAAIRYGGGAVNGAINLIDGKVPKALPDGGIAGAYEMRYGTGDQEMTTASRVTAAIGPIAFHAEGSYSDRENYEVPDAFGTDKLRDSFGESSSYAFGASWITDSGYIGASYTRNEAEYGLPGHSHINGVCHTHGSDLHCAAHGDYDDPFGSPDDHTAYIDLKSERVDLRGDFQDLLPGIANIRLRGSYTDYVHSEIDGPSLFSRYTNEVWDGRIELTHKPLFGFTGTLGLQYTDGTFTGLNVSDLHQIEPGPDTILSIGFLPPFEYVTENIGLFLVERRSFGPVDIELAARKDWREITLPTPEFSIYVAPEFEERLDEIYGSLYGPDWRSLMHERRIESYHEDSPDSEHNPFSASIGATWNIANGYSAALSLARTERAPNVRELYAYGNNLATNSYELGLLQAHRASSRFPDPRLDVMETAKTVNLTFRKAGGPLEFEIGLYHQDVSDYIFARLLETETETGVPHHYLLYTASDASFTGIDGQVSYAFSPEARVTVFGDYVGTDLTSEEVDVDLDASADNLPRISPGRLGTRVDLASGPISADIEYYHTFAQDKVALYETPTDGYGMLNATFAYRFEIPGGGDLEVYARGTNLTNQLAYVHTSFVKDQSPLRGRSVVLGLRHSF
ncbi:TonB-dependent receptor domain-containing protein [Pelagerythrobacter marensis]|uniref:Membrane protein n=1 Tax=Pelagerythrobacter marensis TaxID=543877 RepID=A0A0G3XB90_9SPHN|nr:TonB-dependent receptor [Pelagerythrobacter marensis]AKM07906.1 membrane protein [Pelagerythrobacter marensis]